MSAGRQLLSERLAVQRDHCAAAIDDAGTTGNIFAAFHALRGHASLFLGLDTPIGPVYLGTGFEEGGAEAFYLFLGRTF